MSRRSYGQEWATAATKTDDSESGSQVTLYCQSAIWLRGLLVQCALRSRIPLLSVDEAIASAVFETVPAQTPAHD